MDDLDFNQLLSSNNKDEVIPSPTEPRISTITAIAIQNIHLSIEPVLFMKEIDDTILDTLLISAKYGDTIKGSITPIKMKKSKKNFYNQITIILNIKHSESLTKTINIKIFNNGNLQLTGLKRETDASLAVDKIISIFNILNKKNSNIFAYDNSDVKDILYNDFTIDLINFNTDFCSRFKIKRDKLQQILIKKYEIYCSYEPCIYPGVNSKYYWNKDYKNYPKKGICYCSKMCNGKGCGEGDGECKKVTISIFQSGNVIITGARNFEQINDAYSFINTIFRDNYSDIKRNNIPFLLEIKNNEKVLLKKSDIVFKNKKIFN